MRRGKKLLLLIDDRFTKLLKTAPLRRIMAFDISNDFNTQLSFTYGAPNSVLTDNGKQFRIKFLLEVQIMYPINANWQTERFNKTILESIRATPPTTRKTGSIYHAPWHTQTAPNRILQYDTRHLKWCWVDCSQIWQWKTTRYQLIY